MQKHFVIACLILSSIFAVGQKNSAKSAAAGKPDKAFMQTIWSGWATLNPDNVAQYYAKGPHVFYDIAPLKYASWDEYQAGVRNVLADYKAATCTVGDDAEVHPAGNYVWGTATVSCDMTHKSDKVDKNTFRWTVIWHKEGGKWLTVHEHVSEPLQ